VAQGSQAAEVEARFNTIIEEYGRFLRNAIVKHCPKDLGLQFNDIEQEARVRLWRALQSEREIADLASYLYRIAVTATIDAIRRVKAKREEQLLTSEDDSGVEAEARVLPADPADRPDRVAERRLLIGKVREALARLADDRRRAVALYLEGMTSKEIAGIMGWTEARARNLAYRGLNDLRGLLQAQGIDYEID
jgi:RNA polymerase sigma factor (sigma-70 family)